MKRQGKEKSSKFSGTKKQICPVCGKEWKYRLKTWTDEDGWHCLHDDEIHSSFPLYFTGREKKMASNLPKNKVLVKGSDGITRICEVKKKKK